MPRDSTQSPTPPPTLKEWVWSFDGADPQTMLRIAVAALEWATASVRDALVADLERMARALTRASERQIPFCLLLRHTSVTSSREWEVRKGTCF